MNRTLGRPGPHIIRGIVRFLCVVLPLIACSVRADTDERATVRIDHVILLDAANTQATNKVYVYVEAGLLKAVSDQPMPVVEGTLAMDAKGGFLLGVLDLDKPATFLILDRDPRADFSVLADTAEHLVLVVEEGVLTKNTLIPSAEVIEKDTGAPPIFTFRTPPASLPIDYFRSKKWYLYDGKYFSANFIAGIFLDATNFSQDDASVAQVGDLTDNESGEVRAFRVGVGGSIKVSDRPWTYSVAGAFRSFDVGYDTEEDETFNMLDLNLNAAVLTRGTLSFGKMKENISMERMMSLAIEQFMERPMALDAMLPSRNVGMAYYTPTANDRMTWSVGVYNDWLDSGESFSESSSQFIGRLTGLPYRNEDGSHLVHLGAAVRYSDLRSGLFRFHGRPESYYAPTFVDTGEFPADEATWLSLELGWRKGPFWVNSEYVHTWVDSSETGDPQMKGGHVTGTWVLTGEARTYNESRGVFGPVIPRKTVEHGGIGLWELSARYSMVDLDDEGVAGGEMNRYSLGLIWYPSTWTRLEFNYGRATLDRFDLKGDTDIYQVRLQLLLQ